MYHYKSSNQQHKSFNNKFYIGHHQPIHSLKSQLPPNQGCNKRLVRTSSIILPFKFSFASDLAKDQASFAPPLCPSPLLVQLYGPAVKAHQSVLVGCEQPIKARYFPSSPLLVVLEGFGHLFEAEHPISPHFEGTGFCWFAQQGHRLPP
jgi:hypothetical protein